MKGEITVPIPGELDAVDMNGIVASAAAIYDYLRKKNQEDINKELYEKIENVGGGGLSDEQVQKKIEAALSALAAIESGLSTDGKVMVEIAQSNGKITNVTVNTDDIASASETNQKIANANNAASAAAATANEAADSASNAAAVANQAKQSVEDEVRARKDSDDALESKIEGQNSKIAEQDTKIEQQNRNIEQQNVNIDAKFDAQDESIEEKFRNQEALINEKQLEVGAAETDTIPTEGSGHLITSGGVHTALKEIAYNESNPEYVKVITDGLGHVLFCIKKDGSVDWAIGIPAPVKKYIDKMLAEYDSREELEDALSRKVDGEYVENPEFIQVVTDGEGKVLEAIKANGNKYSAVPVENDAATVYSESNPEWIKVIVDAEGKVLAGIRTDGSMYIAKLDGDNKEGNTNENVDFYSEIFGIIDDVEGRIEITVDADGKILSYRKKDGTKVEEKLEVHELVLSDEAKKQLEETLDIKSNDTSRYKSPYLPKYGTVNIKQETFYLTADSRYSGKDEIVLIQELEDNDTNAGNLATLSNFYIKSTLNPLPNGGYDKTSISQSSVKLDFYAASKVIEIDGRFYVADSLGDGNSVIGGSIEVKKIVDVPPYQAWPVDKNTEHYCIVDVDFGNYFSNSETPVGVKYQGSSTLYKRKRNFRFTFYKTDDYKKKNKIKIGELVRLSGYNLKANWSDNSRIKEFMLNRIILEVWLKRPQNDRFPWDNRCGFYTGATGFINGFPIRTYIGGEFYGMHIFGLKKDEKNYMLDGDDDDSGIFVSGTQRGATNWTAAKPSDWEDEMEAVSPMSESTTKALTDFFAFINNKLTVDGAPVEFDKTTIPERMDVQGWIDYFICMQVFLMWDSICRNMILHTQADKKKFYPYFYDLDLSMQTSRSYDDDIFDIAWDTVNGEKRMNDMSLWKNIKDIYWDEIINRYAELRRTVLNMEYITSIYEESTDVIPQEDYILENKKWGVVTDKGLFDSTFLSKLQKRFEWLDNYYFIN